CTRTPPHCFAGGCYPTYFDHW
nr:immunoglobulin heavy chain junction region [Macaca mulatta]MOV39512.1 immunoglobulin heavy chain junction region [Macaca mulatta]MOV41356.1 immunoglobulin heavy chain junction region [Macaca mulatta]MOV42218.1 immunoglobulin heavy chain junction region [Macaca mulatta]MOV42984.1 immunoglobulin heavy chain junction region [Macaca mulatta]